MTLSNSLRLAEGPQYLPYRYCHIRLYLQLSFNRFLLALRYRLLWVLCMGWGWGRRQTCPGTHGTCLLGLLRRLNEPLFDDHQAMAPHSSTLAWKLPWTE